MENLYRLADLIDSWGGIRNQDRIPNGQNPPIEKIEEAFEVNKDIKALYAVYNETSTGLQLDIWIN